MSITEKTVTKKVVEVTIKCDRCKVPIPGKLSLGSYRCDACKCDLCSACVVRDSRHSPFLPNPFCKPCWSLGECYRERQDVVTAIAKREVSAIEQEWHAAAKAANRVKP